MPHHITGDHSLLNFVENIAPCSVAFAESKSYICSKYGIVCFVGENQADNVLYVQDLNFTLILVAKLLKQTNCLALFSDTICVFDDCFSRTLIQAGEERDGVYYFIDIVSAKSHRAVGGSDILFGISVWDICLF